MFQMNDLVPKDTLYCGQLLMIWWHLPEYNNYQKLRSQNVRVCVWGTHNQ